MYYLAKKHKIKKELPEYEPVPVVPNSSKCLVKQHRVDPENFKNHICYKKHQIAAIRRGEIPSYATVLEAAFLTWAGSIGKITYFAFTGAIFGPVAILSKTLKLIYKEYKKVYEAIDGR